MPEQPLHFDVIVTPHRSLSAKGFTIVMGLFGLVSFVMGCVYVSLGLWPVVGFLGLDVALLYFAFHLNFRSGRMVETIQLSDENLTIRRIRPNGKIQEWNIPPTWLQVILDGGDHDAGRLLLRSHGRFLQIAQFLNFEEKQDLAQALQEALARRQRAIFETA